MSGSIAIIGMPCAGKTSVGRLIAERIGAAFIDTDELVEQTLGMSVSDIFDKYGEHKFRELESEAVRSAVERGGAVIALGGGAVMREANARSLENCTVVYLRVSEETLISRMGKEDSRPLLRGNAAEKFHRLLSERAEVYERTASVTVDADGLSVAEAADAVITALSKA